ncbi:hypothetical protein D3C78_1687830 [compost metagenome]
MLQDGASADISVVFHDDIAIAMHAGREGHKVADYAVMCYVAVDIGVKLLANADIAGQADKRAQDGPRAYFHLIQHDRIGCLGLQELHTVRFASRSQLLSHCAVGNGKCDVA